MDKNDKVGIIKEGEDAHLLEKLNEFIVKKNTMRLSEYEQYAPLFRTEGMPVPTENSSEEEVWVYNDRVEHLRELGTKWSFRVSLNHPVRIVENSDETKVLFTLPAVFSTIPPVNTNDDTGEATDKVDALMNMIKLDDSFRDRVTPAAKQVQNMVKNSRTEEEREELKKEFLKHASVIEKNNTETPEETFSESEVDPKEALDGVVWE